MLMLGIRPMEWRRGPTVSLAVEKASEANQAGEREKAQQHAHAIGHGNRLRFHSRRGDAPERPNVDDASQSLIEATERKRAERLRRQIENEAAHREASGGEQMNG
jgi:hypothetical protein